MKFHFSRNHEKMKFHFSVNGNSSQGKVDDRIFAIGNSKGDKLDHDRLKLIDVILNKLPKTYYTFCPKSRWCGEI